MTSSTPPSGAKLALGDDLSSNLSSLICDLSQKVQATMDSMLKMIDEIVQNSSGTTEDIEKSKDSVLQRKRNLEGEKDHFHKTASAVLDMLNNREP